MSTALGLTTKVADGFNYTTTDALANTVADAFNLQNTLVMTYGAASNTSIQTTSTPTKLYLNVIPISIASSIHDMDLTQLVDVYGNVLNFSKVFLFIAKNNDVAGGSGVILKPGPSNGWTGMFNGISTSQLLVQAGGTQRIENPYTGYTVSGSSKILRLQNDAASPSGANSITVIIAGL